MAKLFRYLKWIAILGLLGAAALVLISPFYIYERFDSEQPIAELYFEAQAPQSYVAYVSTGGCGFERFEVNGDQWQLDATFLKWQGRAVLLGLDSLYKLERLSGRYHDIAVANQRASRAYDLSPEVALDLFALAGQHHSRWVDTQFGSSVFMDMDSSKLYRVYKTEDALIARAAPRSAQPLASDCQPGYLAQVMQYANHWALQFM